MGSHEGVMCGRTWPRTSSPSTTFDTMRPTSTSSRNSGKGCVVAAIAQVLTSFRWIDAADSPQVLIAAICNIAVLLSVLDVKAVGYRCYHRASSCSSADAQE